MTKTTTRLLAAVAAGTIVFAGCSADSTDFQAAAEKAINDTPELDEGTCDKPSDSDVNTTFDCTGTGADGTVYPLLATITSKDRVEVTPAVEDETVVDEDATEETEG